MSEVVGDFTGRQVGPTFFRGTKPIDGVWVTKDIQVANACVMPAGFGVGNHRMFVVDFRTQTLVGASPLKAVRVAARRLNTMIPHVAELKARAVDSGALSKLETYQCCNIWS